MKIHYLQHVSFESPAFIGEWLLQRGHELSSTHFYQQGFTLPAQSDFDALLVMGGPMGVYDEADHPWLVAEKDFISRTIGAGKKVLGICLGAQLLATVLGATVSPAPHKEIGWFPVTPADDPAAPVWFTGIFRNNPVVFHWHGDQFAIPPGSVNLLDTPANTNQAFYFHPGIIGLQFHLETTTDSLSKMLDNSESDLDGSVYVQSRSRIEESAAFITEANKLMSLVLDCWLGL